MKEIISALEQLEKNIKNTQDTPKTDNAIQIIRKSILNRIKHSSGHEKSLLEQLDSELSIWQGKLNIILKESAGRDGMAKHAKHWITSLRGGTQ